MLTADNPYLSLVIPVFDEEDSVAELHRRICSALAGFDRPWEVIYVDDGSKDNSFAVLMALHAEDPRVTVVRLRRNFGQTAAMAAGIDSACGKVVVTLDADLQNDPEDIARLVTKLDEGYDVVSGWRVARQDNLLRRLPSRLANRLISTVTGVRLHDYGCSLKAYRREVLNDFQLYGEMHRFIPALCRWRGAEVTEMAVTHHPRRAGRSKYGLDRTMRVVLDLLTVKFLLDFATKPIQLFGRWGLGAFGIGIGLLTYLAVDRLVLQHTIGNRPLLTLAVLLVFSGVQLVTLGLMAELVTRTYFESQGRKPYTIRDTLCGSPAGSPAAQETRSSGEAPPPTAQEVDRP